jgi:prepilin-type N-terminal cleavage/methylation domain-containing protein
MFIKTTPNNRGFTLIEIVVVLVLISIVAAAAFQRSVTTGDMNLASQFNKIQNQIRYPQSMAMKEGKYWGFAHENGNYWIFTGSNKNTVPNQRLLPGQKNIKISLTDLGLTMIPNNFTVIFDSYGIPYSSDINTPLNPELDVYLSETGSPPRTFTILPETGLVR